MKLNNFSLENKLFSPKQENSYKLEDIENVEKDLLDKLQNTFDHTGKLVEEGKIHHDVMKEMYQDFKKILNKFKIGLLFLTLSSGLTNYIQLKMGKVNEDFSYSEFGDNAEKVKKERQGAYKKEFSEYCAKNIIPVGYGLTQYEPGEQSLHYVFSKTFSIDLTNEEHLQDRYDAWYFYLGLPQKFKTFSVSEYKPSMSTDSNHVYYSMPNKEDYLLVYGLQVLDSENVEKKLVTEYNPNNTVIEENIIPPYASDDSLSIESLFPKDRYGVMGQFMISKGIDQKGQHYISYYDKWDLTPFQDFNIKKEVSEIINIGKPFEIYGRIYYDPKTKKRID